MKLDKINFNVKPKKVETVDSNKHSEENLNISSEDVDRDSSMYNNDGTLKTKDNVVLTNSIKSVKNIVALACAGAICLTAGCAIVFVMNRLNNSSINNNSGNDEDTGVYWSKMSDNLNDLLDSSLITNPIYYNLTVTYNTDKETGDMGYIIYNDGCDVKKDISYGYSYTTSKNGDIIENSSKYLTTGGYKEYSKDIETNYGEFLNLDGLYAILRYQTSTDVPNLGYFKYDASDIITFSNSNSLNINLDSKPTTYNPCSGYSFDALYNTVQPSNVKQTSSESNETNESNDEEENDSNNSESDGVQEENNSLITINSTVLYNDYGERKFVEAIEIPNYDWNVNLVVDKSDELIALNSALINVIKENIDQDFAVNTNEVTIVLDEEKSSLISKEIEDMIGNNSISEFLEQNKSASTIKHSIIIDNTIGSMVKHTITADNNTIVFTVSNSSKYINTNVQSIKPVEIPDSEYWSVFRDFVAQSALNQYIEDQVKENEKIINNYNLEHQLSLDDTEEVED